MLYCMKQAARPCGSVAVDRKYCLNITREEIT